MYVLYCVVYVCAHSNYFIPRMYLVLYLMTFFINFEDRDGQAAGEYTD